MEDAARFALKDLTTILKIVPTLKLQEWAD